MNLFFKATGGVPVDRSKSHGIVDAMTLNLKESKEMIVAVPAEGTRSWVPKWKNRFLPYRQRRKCAFNNGVSLILKRKKWVSALCLILAVISKKI